MVERLSSRPTSFESAAIIFNPAAGKKDRRPDLDVVAKRLQAHGWGVEIYPTKGPGDATQIASGLAEKGHTIAIGGGGDGTQREIVEGLLDHGSSAIEVVSAQLRFGTVNVGPAETHLSKNMLTAADELAKGRIVGMDVGKLNGRIFRLMAGVGLDGEVMGKVGDKKGRGVLPYFASAIKEAISYKGIPGELTVDDYSTSVKLLQVWFGNTQRLAYGTLRPEGRADDGILEATVFQGDAAWQLIPCGALTYILRGRNNPLAISTQGKRFTLDLARAAGIELDGEPFLGEKHIEVGIEPLAHRVLVPNKKIEIFSSQDQAA